MQRPWLKLYTRDYLDHKELRRCSHVARSIWADLICLMAEGTPIGFLTDKNGPLEMWFVASRIVAKEAEVKRAIAELIEKQVAKVTSSGTLYSPKIVKDEEIRLRRASGGTLSQDNPNVPRIKDTHNGYPSNGSKDTLNSHFSVRGEGPPYIASDSGSGSSELPRGGVGEIPVPPLYACYDVLVAAWPAGDKRGVDLGAQTWISLVDSGEVSDFQQVADGLERWKNSESWAKDGGRYIPAIGKWLFARAWKDFPKQADGW